MPGDMMTIRATLTIRNDKIISAREKRGWSQRRLAEEAGTFLHMVAQLEKLDYTHGHVLEHAIKIAEALQLGLEDVIPADASYAVPNRMQQTKDVHVSQLRLMHERTVERLVLPAPDAQAEENELSRVLDKAMNILTPRQRQVLTLRANGLTDKKIAERIKTTPANVWSLVNTAIHKMRHPKSIRQIERDLGIDKQVELQHVRKGSDHA
jgi:RNA polymerase sigma factor (sigma-70 family)